MATARLREMKWTKKKGCGTPSKTLSTFASLCKSELKDFNHTQIYAVTNKLKGGELFGACYTSPYHC